MILFSEFLDKFKGHKFVENALIQAPIYSSDSERIRRLVMDLMKVYNVNLVERDFIGYYVVRTKERELWGIFPITYIELFWFVCYLAIIVFPKPSRNVGQVFVASTFYYENIEDRMDVQKMFLLLEDVARENS